MDAQLRDYLVANVPSVDGRVHPGELPQAPAYPSLTLALVSDPRGETHDGPDGTVEARYQVTAWSPDHDVAIAAAAEVRGALFGFTGDMGGVQVARIGYEGGPNLFTSDVGPQGRTGVHHAPRDYVIQFTEEN